MPAFTIQVTDTGVLDALNRLVAAGRNPSPVLKAIGEDIVERSKQRFDSATGPDGQRWAANKPSTMARYLHAKGGYGKRGLTKKGALLQANKKPLQGLSGDLRRQIDWNVANNVLTVFANPAYAAMQQFGGTKSAFPNLWGDIPARPFLPITSGGQLYAGDRDRITSMLAQFIMGAARGER